MDIEVIEPELDHWHEFEPMEEDPYHVRCTCGEMRDVGGEYA
jgi:hypothetical protein